MTKTIFLSFAAGIACTIAVQFLAHRMSYLFALREMMPQ